MAAPDMDVIKEIPGYKVILKAILKSQIQQLVEQLASHTDEESVILTASVSDGTLSHLGSDSGKNFLEDHEDIKSQFLGFCLKKHHRKKQQEKERQELLQSIPTTPTRFEGHPFPPQRSPRFTSPRQQSVHPVALTRASPGALRPMGMRHQPYPMRPRRPNFEPESQARAMNVNPQVRMPVTNQVIKIEADDPDESQASTEQSTNGADKNVESSLPSSPSHTASETAQSFKTELGKDTDANSESSTSTIPNEAALSDTVPPEGLSLDSDLSNLMPLTEDSLAGDNVHGKTSLSAPQTPSSSSGLDPGVNVKVEAITESEMELEITGVELAPKGTVDPPAGSQESWGPDMQGGMAYSGASGSQADFQSGQQGYRRGVHARKTSEKFDRNPSVKPQKKSHKGKPPYICCGKTFKSPANLTRHRCSEHAETKKYVCDLCGRGYAIQADLNRHRRREVGEKQFKCKTCDFRCFELPKLQEHEDIHKKVSRYFCEVCGQVFRFSSNLSRHRKKHRIDVPKCVLCAKVFNSLKMLQKHMKKH